MTVSWFGGRLGHDDFHGGVELFARHDSGLAALFLVTGMGQRAALILGGELVLGVFQHRDWAPRKTWVPRGT